MFVRCWSLVGHHEVVGRVEQLGARLDLTHASKGPAVWQGRFVDHGRHYLAGRLEPGTAAGRSRTVKPASGARYAALMLDRQGFVQELLEVVPQAEPTVAEHLDDQDGELLLHLLLSDLLRLTVAAFHGSDRDVCERLLGLMARGLGEGDEYVSNAVAVSFVEGFGAGPGETDDLLALWPPVLRGELGR